MHVAHLTLPFEYACGISRHVWTLAREQLAERVTVLTSGGAATELLEADGIPWVRLPIDPSARAPWAVGRTVMDVVAFARSEGVTVLHAHHRYHAVVARLAGLLLPGVRVVATCHSVVTGARYLSYPVSHVIAVSAATRDHLQHYFGIPSERIVVIPNALPPEPRVEVLLHPTVSGALGTRPIILGVGRLSREKGFDTLIRAIPKMKRSTAEPLLVLVGEGPERASLEALARSEGVAAVLTGAVPTARPYVDVADVVVQPSRTESFSLMALQAGVAGKPFVASAVDGLPELIEHGRAGLLVPVEDPSALAAAIDSTLEEPALAARLGAALKNLVASLPDAAGMAAATRRVYELKGIV